MIIKSNFLISVLTGVFKLLSLIVPCKKSLVCFLSQPDVADNAYHLFRYLLTERPDLTLAWLAKDQKSADAKLKSLGYSGIKVFKKNSLRGIFFILRSQSVFHTHGTYRFISLSKKRKIVNLWHGMPIKGICYLDDNYVGPLNRIDRSDYVISTSILYSFIMASAFNTNYRNILVSGLPRNDVLIQPQISRTNFLRKINAPESIRLGIWLPTYRSSSGSEPRSDSSASSFLDELPFSLSDLNQALAREKTIILIKIHPLDIHPYKQQSHSNIKLLSSEEWEKLSTELHDALSITDFLVSDISSVIIDYMLTGRPIVRIDPLKRGYSRALVYDFDFDSYENMFVAESLSDFMDAIARPPSVTLPPKAFHAAPNGNFSKAVVDRLL